MSEPYVTTFKDRVKRAIKAFKGDPVGSISFGVDVKRCSDCEYKNRHHVGRILYICDGRACKTCHSDFCRYTTDIRYAANFNAISEDGDYMENDDQTLDSFTS